MKITAIYNGIPIRGFEGDFEHVYLYDNRYFFEKIVALNLYSEREINGVTTEPALAPSTSSDILTGYLLTDMRTGICVEFDSASISPKVINVFPLQEKDQGIRLYPEQITFLDIAADQLRHSGDTAFEGRTYKLLTESKPRSKNAQGFTLIKNIAWLDAGLKGFPFHISKKLDEQFNGYISRIDQVFLGGSVVSFNFAYKNGLNATEIAQVKLFIAKAEAAGNK